MNPNGNTSPKFKKDETIDLEKLFIYHELSKTMFGLSDKKISESIGISGATLRNIIENKAKITVKTGEKLILYFGAQIKK